VKVFTRPLAESWFYKALACSISQIKFRLYGVSFGRRLRAVDVEILNIGRIVLGHNVHITSRALGNPYRSSLRTYYPESRIEIGDHCIINGAVIHSNCAVTIGAHSRLAPGVTLCDNDSHVPARSIESRELRPPEAPIRLGTNVWLGMRSIILKGVTIGDNTIVAAGSIVTRDLPANVLAGGIPAKVIRTLD
jgi:acetyltransferase-like isoleucine patch superfamily enzyme